MLALGRELSALLQKGTVISLEGPLGAGKTQLSKGVAAALGCRDEASSPSFTLVHEYAGGRLPLHHFDFYRLKSPDELMASATMIRSAMERSWWSGEINSPKHYLPMP